MSTGDAESIPAREQMRVDLRGMVALVTGGGTGIGRALSLNLARCGAAVVVNYSKSRVEAEDTVAEIKKCGGRALALPADLTVEDQAAALCAATKKAFGRLDILVANAGATLPSCPTAELDTELWRRGLDLNCSSAFYCVKHAAPLLTAGQGRIILTSSMSARTGSTPGALTYVAAKGALNSMVRNWAKEFGPRGITVNVLSPGVVWTRMHEGRTSPENREKLTALIPLGRVGEPEDMVGPVLLLASREGGYINGQILEVNGGSLMP